LGHPAIKRPISSRNVLPIAKVDSLTIFWQIALHRQIRDRDVTRAPTLPHGPIAGRPADLRVSIEMYCIAGYLGCAKPRAAAAINAIQARRVLRVWLTM
jgi:hypothetical protein